MAWRGTPCANWCHWGDDRCTRSDCFGCGRCVELAAIKQAKALIPALPQRASVAADHPALVYSGYYHKYVTDDHATFHREWSTWVAKFETFGLAARENPGVALRFVTNAQRATAALEYTNMCETACPGRPRCEYRFICHCECAVRTFVDGILVHDFESENRAQWDKGDVTVEVLPFAPSPAPERVVEVVLPWCASITFRGIELHSEASAPAPRVCADTPPPRRVYAAIGDSITHGWCGNVTYPTELARWNGWEPRNLGIQGLALMGAGYGREMGSAILKSGADFATVMIGINDCGKTDPSMFRLGLAGLIDTVRAAKPELPLAIITPTYGNGCNMRHLRDATVDEVEPRLATDRHLVLIKGQALLAAAFLLREPAGNPHPSVAGSNELAANLNAELGFGRLGFDVLGCAGGVFSLRLKGLTASGEFAVFGGPATERDGGERMGSAIKGEALKALGGRCKQRSLMLTPQRQQLGRADDRGGAKVEVAAAGACDASAFQVVDLSTCVTSRVGSARVVDATAFTLAPLLGPPSPAPPREAGCAAAAPASGEAAELRCYAQRYPDLLSGFCGGDVGSCDWPRLMDHWWASGQKEDRIYGCEQKNKKEGKAAPALSPPPPPPPALAKGEEAELRCYAERYPDLLAGFCGGDAAGCDWLRLRDHWKLGGEAEGRTFGCEAKKPKKQTVEHAPKKLAPRTSPPPPPVPVVATTTTFVEQTLGFAPSPPPPMARSVAVAVARHAARSHPPPQEVAIERRSSHSPFVIGGGLFIAFFCVLVFIGRNQRRVRYDRVTRGVDEIDEAEQTTAKRFGGFAAAAVAEFEYEPTEVGVDDLDVPEEEGSLVAKRYGGFAAAAVADLE